MISDRKFDLFQLESILQGEWEACVIGDPVGARSLLTGSGAGQTVTDRNQLRPSISANFYPPGCKTKDTRYPQISDNICFVSVNIEAAGLTPEGSQLVEKPRPHAASTPPGSNAFRVRDRSGKPESDRGTRECGLEADSPTALLLSAGTPNPSTSLRAGTTNLLLQTFNS